MQRRHNWLPAILALLVFSGCAAQKSAAPKPKGDNESAEADKVLYERAENDLQHNRFDVARLSMQTLINTYPDSEYLAKAKLAIADSYYKEGGSTGLTQAVAEYQDFITFFPFLDEAAYAQMQIGMAHFRRMEKADRDTSEALEAEAAFQTFVQKYPKSELEPQAEQRLREVQEVLADGDFRIASFYYIRKIDRAAASRLTDLINRYPLYSAADRANWMLASLYERNKHNDVASTYYARLVKEYPLSPLAGEAKNKLTKLGVPVPEPDPAAMARMQREQNTPRPRPSFLKRPGEMLKSGPDVSAAARVGAPNLTPQSDDATDTLTPGGGLSVLASGAGSSTTKPSGGVPGAYVPTASPAAGDPPADASGSASNSATGANDPPAAASAGQDQSAQADGSGSSAESANTSADSSTQSNHAQGESSSKKKKNKKQAQLQPQ